MSLFEGTGVAITAEGRRAVVDTLNFVESYVEQKISTWVHEVEHLSPKLQSLSYMQHMQP